MSKATLQIEHLPADVLELSPQAKATLAGRPRPPVLPGMVVPATIATFPRPTDLLDRDDRADLVRALESHLEKFRPHDFVLDSVRALAQPGASLVVTGQQPAFLGGPLYNVYKALHAIRLARDLSQEWGTPVLPAFWNHADDHDIAEAHHLWIQNGNLDLFKLGLANMSSGRAPLSHLVLDEERQRFGVIREALRQSLWEGAQRETILEHFLPRHGETFSNSFTRILLSLFGHHGLLVIEPDWIREPLSRALARVVGGNVRGCLDEGTAWLRDVGQQPAIDPGSAALLFRHAGGERRALRSIEDGFQFDDEPGSRTTAELVAEIIQSPRDWSPGALLRPLAQDLALPVAAYVGGWGELAYHAQLPPLRDQTQTPRTPFIPRLSASLLDPEMQRSLEKLGLTAGDVLRARGHLVEGNTSGEEEAPVVARLREVAQGTIEALNGLREELSTLDRGLAAQIRRTGDQVRGLIERLATKAERVHANQQGRGRRHYRRLNHGLFPRGLPQERVRGLVEFAARFGTAWLDTLLEEFEPLPTEHLVVHLNDSPDEGGPR